MFFSRCNDVKVNTKLKIPSFDPWMPVSAENVVIFPSTDAMAWRLLAALIDEIDAKTRHNAILAYRAVLKSSETDFAEFVCPCRYSYYSYLLKLQVPLRKRIFDYTP